MSGATPPAVSGEDILREFTASAPPVSARVAGDTILDEFGRSEALSQRLSPLQGVGYRLAMILLVMISIIILLLGFQWWAHTPPTLVLPTVTSENVNTSVITTTASLLQQYKIANDIAREGPMQLFDQVIVKVLFPLLTGVIGYIFGARSAERADNPSR